MLKTILKIIVCCLTAALITALVWGLILEFHKEPVKPTPPPPCLLACQNGGVCLNNRCRCPNTYTGDLCTQENFCRYKCDNSSQCYTFGEILAGMYGYSQEVCANNTVNANAPLATVQCVINGSVLTLGPIQEQNCNQNLETLANETVSTDNAQDVAITTQILTSEPRSLQAENITNALRIVNRLLTLEESTEEVGESAVATVSQILNANSTEFTAAEVAKEAESLTYKDSTPDSYLGTQILLDAHCFLMKYFNPSGVFQGYIISNDYKAQSFVIYKGCFQNLTKKMEQYSVNIMNKTLSVVQPSIAVEKRPVSASNQNGISFMAIRGLAEEDGLISSRIIVDNNTPEFVHNETAELQIFIKPFEGLDNDTTVGFVLYQNDNLFPSSHGRALNYNKRIISASIANRTYADVEFSFNQKVNSAYTLVQYSCVYWDYEQNEWSTAGCEKKALTKNTTTLNDTKLLQCVCNHTTNFAVLMNFRENIDYKGLDIVSTIGCVLSIVGLTITIAFLLYVSIGKKQKVSWILLSLCTAMLIFYIIFIATMEYTKGKGLENQNDIDLSINQFLTNELEDYEEEMCTALAVLLHYFLLTTFILTAMLAAEYYIRLVLVRHFVPEHFHKITLITGWGLPLLIVLITFGATYKGGRKNNYHRKEFCWLSGEDNNHKLDLTKPLLWSFLVPVGIILVANVCIAIAVSVASIWRTNPALTSTKRISLLKKTLATLSVACLLGVTWIIGYLMLIEANENTQIIFSFIFSICCATQGLQIFILYTLRSRQFLEKVVALIRLFNSCKIYMHSEKYWVNRIRRGKTHAFNERFRNLSESTAGLVSGNSYSKE